MSASSLASKVLQTSSQLKSTARQTRSEVEKAEKSWSGSGYNSFKSAYGKVERQFLNINSSWQNIAAKLNSLSHQVEAAERDRRAKLQEERMKGK